MRTKHLPLAALLVLLLLMSCSSKGRVRRETTIGTETYEVVMPTSRNIVHPEHGKEEWFAVGALSGEGDVKANGVAQSHVFTDGTTIATVNLNIQPAAKEFQYVVWLERDGGQDRVKLETLQNPFGDVRHVITGTVKNDLRDHTEVVVRLEPISGSAGNGPIQATGTLKERTR